MRYLMAIFITFGILGASFAQKQDFTKSADNDPEATRILDKVSAKYEAYKSLEAIFTLKIEIPEEPADVQKGKLMQEGEKYHVDLQEMAMICDGVENFWVHNKRNEEVQLNDIPEDDESDDMLAPQEFYNFYKSGKYVYALTNAIVEEGKPLLQIEFKPLSDESEYFKIRMTIEKKTNIVKRVKVFAKDGSKYTLDIEKVTPNKKFAATNFVFNKKKYPNVDIEDLKLD